MRNIFGALLIVAALACGACDAVTEPKPAIAIQAASETVQADPELADPLGRELGATAARVAPGWTKIDKLWRGELRPREQRGFLAVLPYGHCYRFIGVAANTVTDFDLVLFDPNGVEVQRDVTQDNTPVLGVDASICPNDPGAYRIEAQPRTGTGAFAIGLYRDPR